VADARIGAPLGASLLLHAMFAAMLFLVHSSGGLRVQTVNIELVPAPPGERNIGVVTQTPPKAEPKAPPKVSAPPRVEKAKAAVPTKTPSKAKVDPVKSTPTPDPVTSKVASAKADETSKGKAVVPDRAGAGDKGGSGSDVTEAVFKGLQFPDQLYLTGILNKVGANFRPTARLPLVAEFTFEIKRDGCVQNVKQVKSSGSAVFNADARTAIDKASQGCFGPLPAAWTDELLRIHFVFDPRMFR
jgi:outer membrane biosynthesis protein TonB